MEPKDSLEQPIYHEIDEQSIQEAFDKERKRLETAGHNWRQQGTMISCTSCPLPHGFSVPPGVFLIGIDENHQPILEKKFDI